MASDVKTLVFIFCSTVCFVAVFRPCCGTCPKNYFGTDPECGYRCHCRKYYSCDEIRGDCGSGCAQGYSGSSCQYDNFARKRTPVANFTIVGGSGYLPNIVDGNSSTCIWENGHSNLPVIIGINEDSWVNGISILLYKAFLAAGTIANANTLEVIYYDSDNASEVLNPHLAKPNDTAIIYHLSQPAVVTRVQIRATGDVPLGLCEVSVHGGRNLAIHKAVSQGDKTYCDSFEQCASADKAVDGNTNTNFSKGSCTHTDGGSERRSWWTMFLGHNLNIWRLKVYVRTDYEPKRMSGFLVNVTLGNGSHVQVYRNTETEPKAVTDIILPEPLAVTNVTVWHEGTGKTLWLCEVQVSGDCMDGYYGWQCQKECQCKDPSEICDKIWGYCPHSRCKIGFRGDDCSLECQTGRYGAACTNNCSEACFNDTCHHVTGNCTDGCKPGWQTSRCEEKCNSGHYGERCSTPCSDGCRDGGCGHVTGTCYHGCLPGWLGELCNETCDAGYHGDNCSLTCSSDCVKKSCDVTSGRCLYGCRAGITGELCHIAEQRDEEDVPWPIVGGVVGGVLLLILVVVITAAVCLCKPRKPKLSLQKRPREDYENSAAILMGPLATEQEEHGVVESHLYAVPNKAGQTNKAYNHETDPETAGPPKAEPQDQTDSAAPTAASSNKDSAPSPKPRTHKPELLSLFSRDACQDVNAGNKDAQQPKTSAAMKEKTPTFCQSKEVMSSSVQSSPRSQRGTPTPARRVASFESLDTLSVDTLDDDEAATPPRSRPTTGDSNYYNVVCRDTSPTTIIPLSELPTRVAKWLDNPRHFSKERAMLPGGKVADWKTALLPENARKNRYRDIYPYDHSRVLLDPLPDDPQSDFYNACYIDGYEKEKEYIAAQGPMDRTLYDFLRLVWDAKCSRIVMLTNTVELGRFKCQQYWPDAGELTAGDITVTVNSVTHFADYCIRHMTFERSGGARRVMMYHYTAWPDNCAPASAWSLLDFRQKLNQDASDEGPVIVHCSAGIGRTGTYLALDIQLLRAQHHSDVDVFACVWKLRQQRIHMVQTLAQYIFIHETLLGALLTSPPVPVEEFDLNCLLQGENGERSIDKEFEQLQMCLGPTKQVANSDNTPPEMQGLPRDVHRVHIVSADGGSTPAYINAVYLSNYSQANAYIQTHTPSDTGGAVNFLSMVVQCHVNSVVCLDPEQDEMYPLWPESKDTTGRIGPYAVTLLSMRKTQGMTVKNLRITCHKSPYSNSTDDDGPPEESREVMVITCTTWPLSRLTPPSVSVLLDLDNAVKPEDDHPVVVYCRDGHTRSGLFCTAAAVLERMRIEGHVAVNYVTAHMRVPRRENLVTVEQYEFLYKCTQHCNHDEKSDTKVNSADAENTYGNLEDIQNTAGERGRNSLEPENEYGNIDILQASNGSDSKTVDASKTSTEDDNVYSEMRRPTDGPADEERFPANNEAAARENDYWDMKTQPGVTTKTEQNSSSALPSIENTYGNITYRTTADPDSDAAKKDGPSHVKAPTTDENLYGNIDSLPEHQSGSNGVGHA
uniref:protein-tyrosine-phosphatase n=1 Tax=Littorina littorea TaxID=31216 RepID=A0A0A7RRM1_LITLI|nr:fucolectin-related molecule [Littorina littorea]